MGKQKYTPEIIELAIKMRLEGKTIPEIDKATGMGKPSQQKLYRQRGIKLTEEQKDAAVIGARWKNHEPIVNGEKLCAACNLTKPISMFHSSKNRSTGLVSSCKECAKEKYLANPEIVKERVRAHRAINKEQINEDQRNYYALNAESFKEYARAYDKANPEQVKSRSRTYRKKNQKSKNARTAKRRANIINATPIWLTAAHIEEMRQIYLNCPKGYHVDHIIPLRGENFSGLHVPWNLQYLLAVENMSKGNRIKKP